MFKILFNRHIGPNPDSFLLPEPVLDVGDYGAVPTTGLTSGHQGCTGCGMVSGTNQVLRALKLTGKHVIASIGTGCNEVITMQNTSCWGDVSVDHNNFPNTAATLSGNIATLKVLERLGLRAPNDTINLGMAGDGGTYDIGLQALLAWIARGENGIYVCLNNQAYMNTGIQGSGARRTVLTRQRRLSGKRSGGTRERRSIFPTSPWRRELPTSPPPVLFCTET